MSSIQKLADAGSNELSEGVSFIDADTIKDDNTDTKYRLAGVDAPEIAKVFGPDKIKPGTVGGAAATTAIQNLAKQEGFTNVVPTGKFDPLGREIADLQDGEGRSWERELIRTGVLDPTRYTSAEAVRAKEVADVFGTGKVTDNWSLASKAIKNAIVDETKYQTQFKQRALNEAQLAYGGGLFADSSVAFRDPDRDLDNKATSPFSTAWDVALQGATEGMYGALELGGHTTGFNWLENIGENGIARARANLADNPEIVTSYKDINGFWGKEGALQYIANNAVISLPYMATSIGGALAAPITGGLSLAAPAGLYAGSVWNDQEGDNKNAFLAITTGISQAVLDRVGLSFLAKGTLLTEAGRMTAARKLATRDNISIEQAKDVLLRASRAETAALADDAARFAKDQLTKRNVARATLQKTAIAMGGEGLTETLQEAIGYTAAHAAQGFRDWDAGEFNDRIIEAAIAGSTLGGAFSVPGTIYDYGAWADVAYRKAPDDARQRSWAGNKAKLDVNQRGAQYNVQEENIKIKENIENGTINTEFNEDINQRREREAKRRLDRDIMKTGRELWRAVPGLWRGLTRQAFGNMGQADRLQEDSKEARILAESLGGNLQRSTSGATYENRKHHLISEIRGKLGEVSKILAKFGRNDKRKSRIEFSEKYYEAYQKALAKAQRENREIDFDTDLEGELLQYKDEFIAFKHLLDEVGNDLWQMQAVHTLDEFGNPTLGVVKDYLSKYKSFNKEAIESNRASFESKLVSVYNMTPDMAKELTDNILRTDGAVNLEDVGFSITSRAKFTPGAHKRRTLGLSEKAEFKEFMENDLFTNVSNAAKSAVRFTAIEEYVGTNNEKINYRLDKIQQELIDSGNYTEDQARERVDRLAYELKDYFDAESGNYNRIESPILNWAQKNLLFVTTITGLPLATISNFVEFALLTKSLTWNQIFGKGGINDIGRAFVTELASIAERGAGAVTGRPTPTRRDKGGHAVARELGFFDWEVGAAHTTGVSEAGHLRQKLLDTYFKVILLQQWTNAARAGRAALAGDYIVDKVSIVSAALESNEWTNEAVEAEEALRNLGIDPRFMAEYTVNFKDAEGNTRAPTAEETKKFDDFMRDGAFNFINEAVALPQSANRPKIFQDPRFALFTQFQGFIATFTANHIPKMWGEMIVRGTPAMKYNIFATLSTMILLGFVSQHLKDLLKYGKTTPYFEGMEYIRRGVGASGLLGTGERVIDFFFPMYQERYKTTFGWAFGTISGESAAISKGLRIGGLGADVVTGDKGIGEAVVRISPLTQAAAQVTKDLPTFSFGEK